MYHHRQSQFQRAHRQETADSCRSPLLLSGDICPYLLATGWCVAFGAAPRPVNRPLGPSLSRVNSFLQFCFNFSRNPRKIRRSEEHTSELQSLMRISYAVFCVKKKKSMQLSQLATRSPKQT